MFADLTLYSNKQKKAIDELVSHLQNSGKAREFENNLLKENEDLSKEKDRLIAEKEDLET